MSYVAPSNKLTIGYAQNGNLTIHINDTQTRLEIVAALTQRNSIQKEKTFFEKFMPEFDDVTRVMKISYYAAIYEKHSKKMFVYEKDGSFIEELLKFNKVEFSLK